MCQDLQEEFRQKYDLVSFLRQLIDHNISVRHGIWLDFVDFSKYQ